MIDYTTLTDFTPQKHWHVLSPSGQEMQVLYALYEKGEIKDRDILVFPDSRMELVVKVTRPTQVDKANGAVITTQLRNKERTSIILVEYSLRKGHEQPLLGECIPHNTITPGNGWAYVSWDLLLRTEGLP